MDDTLTATLPTCDAFLRETVIGGYGPVLVQCSVTRGLSAHKDYSGQTRRACGSPGHAARVVRMYGVAEPEPDWALR